MGCLLGSIQKQMDVMLQVDLKEPDKLSAPTAYLWSSWTGMLPIHLFGSENNVCMAPAASLLSMLRPFVRMASPEATRPQMPVLKACTAKAAKLRISRPCKT